MKQLIDNVERKQHLSMAIVELGILKSGSHSLKHVANSLSASRRVWGISSIWKVGRLGLRRQLLLAIPLVIAGFPALRAAADEDDALNVLLGARVTYDSNLFRTPGSTDPQSDVIRTGYVGLRIDKPYSQQRFQFDVTETDYRYNKFSNLNFDGLDYRGAWLWHLTPRVSGTLSADRSESLVPFQDILNNNRDVRIIQNRIFTLDGWVFGGWHALLGISQSEQNSEQPSAAAPDFRGVSGEAGVKYLASSGSSLAILRRATNGEYLNSIVFAPANFAGIDNYRQDESELQANWILNARSTVTARLTWLERRNDHFIQGDFSGLGGILGYTWTPTAKLSLDFGAQRQLSPWQDPSSTYKVDNIISFAPSWQASAKVAVRARLEHIQSYFRGGVVANVPSRNDTTNNALIGLDWLPLRSLTIGASLQRLQTSSNYALFEYDATVVNVGAVLKF